MVFGVLYFFVPLLGTFEFSLRYLRGVYSLEAYRIVLADPRFGATVTYSTALALATIVVGVVLVVPTAYWIQLRLPGLRPVVEFITLLPLVIPAIVLVFGYLRIYNSSSFALDGERADNGPAADLQLRDAGPAVHVPRGRYWVARH